MKKLKQLLCLILALIMVLSSMPVMTLAEEIVSDFEGTEIPGENSISQEEEFVLEENTEQLEETMLMPSEFIEGYCGGESDGTNLTWTLNNEGTLTISGSGAMVDYATSSSHPWYDYRSQIKTIVIGNEVTSIGNFAFYKCTGISQISIPDSVITIGDYSFEYCSGLENVSFGRYLQKIGDCAFYRCSSMTQVVIPDNVTYIGSDAFYECDNITSIILGEKVETIGSGAFSYCDGITQITIPESVTSIGGIAIYGESLEAIYFEGDAPAVVAADLVNRSFPENVTLYYRNGKSNWSTPKWNGYNTQVNNYIAKGYCGGEEDGTNLSWTLANDGTLTISGSGAMADYKDGSAPWHPYRDKLTSLVLEDGITSIGDYAFYHCNGFSGSLTIPDGVTSIGDQAFFYCNGFTGSLTIPDSVTVIGHDAFNLCSGFNGSLTISNGITAIGFGVFAGCSGFTGSLTIPDGVTTIGEMAFYCCDGFTGSLSIPDSVTSIDVSAFAFCDGLTGSLIIPDKVTSIGDCAFLWCESFTGALAIGAGVTTIGEEAFFGCSGISGIYFEGNAPTAVAATANYPSFDTKTTLYYLGGKTGWTTPKWNGYNTAVYSLEVASGKCGGEGNGTNLTWVLDKKGTLTISGSGSMEDYGYLLSAQKSSAPWADYCDQITKIVIEEGVTTIGAFAFMGCTKVTQLPEFPSTLTKIKNEAFQKCTGLSGDIVIPDSVTYLAQGIG